MQSGAVLSSTPHLSALWSVGRVNIFGLPSTHDLHLSMANSKMGPNAGDFWGQCGQDCEPVNNVTAS